MSEDHQPENANEKPVATEATEMPPSPSAEEQIAALKKEAALNYDRYTRAIADMENFRKRTAREKDELRQFAASGVVEDVIPVLDNLSLGLAAAKQQSDVKAVVDGVGMVLEQFKTTLARHGLKEINPLGQPFDPNFHDCISHQPNAKIPAEHVSEVVRLGYSLNGRLLRPASVVVSSGDAEAKS